MSIDPAAILAVISEQAKHIATLEVEIAQLRASLTELQPTTDQEA